MTFLDPPVPGSGCEFGDRWPGWRIVVEAFYNGDDGSRTFGTDLFGDGVFGDAGGSGVEAWQDITSPVFNINCIRGGDGSIRVPVDELNIELKDLDGDLFPFKVPASYYSPRVGSYIRFGVLSPTNVWFPQFTGRIERIEDIHDGDGVRTVEIAAFGLAMDLVAQIPSVDFPGGQTVAERLEQVLTEVGWAGERFASFPAATETLRRFVAAEVEGRGLVDQVANSAGWFFYVDERGVPTVEEWPIASRGANITVTDCLGRPSYASPSIQYVSDLGAVLNVAEASSLPAADGSDEGVFASAGVGNSIGAVGPRSQTYGFPLSGLSGRQATLDALCQRAVTRYAQTVTRVLSFEVDSLTDDRWLGEIQDVYLGRPIFVDRWGLPSHQMMLTGIVTGIQHRVVPNRWQSTVVLNSTDDTL